MVARAPCVDAGAIPAADLVRLRQAVDFLVSPSPLVEMVRKDRDVCDRKHKRGHEHCEHRPQLTNQRQFSETPSLAGE